MLTASIPTVQHGACLMLGIQQNPADTLLTHLQLTNLHKYVQARLEGKSASNRITNKITVEHPTQVEFIYSERKWVAFLGTQPTLLGDRQFLLGTHFWEKKKSPISICWHCPESLNGPNLKPSHLFLFFQEKTQFHLG